MNPEAQLLAALEAFQAATDAAKAAARTARDALKDEPLATTLKAYSVLEQLAYEPVPGMPSLSFDQGVGEAIDQLRARAAAV